MVRIWKVTFEGESPGSADDFTLEFTDIRDVIGEFIGLKTEAIKKIKEKIEKYENYHEIGNVKEIVGPEGEGIVEEACIVLLGIDKNEMRFGFLLALAEDKISLIALWPKAYADAVRDNDRLLSGVIYYMVERPDNWRRVDLVLPLKK